MPPTSSPPTIRRFWLGHGWACVPSGPFSPSLLPTPRPVWFEYSPPARLQLFSFASSPKVQRTRTHPRVSLLVANDVGEPNYRQCSSVAPPSKTAALTHSPPDWRADTGICGIQQRWRPWGGYLANDPARIVIEPDFIRRCNGGMRHMTARQTACPSGPTRAPTGSLLRRRPTLS